MEVVGLLESAVGRQQIDTLLLVYKILCIALHFIVDILNHVWAKPLYNLAFFPETEFDFSF